MARRTVPTTAVTLGAAVLLSATMTTASAAPAASHTSVRQPHHRPVLVDCFWHPRVQPTDFVLACGDGNSRLVSMHWVYWGRHSAMARGVNVVNDCKPFCAAGRFHSYRVTVRLDRAEPWKRHPRLEQFTRMRLVYPDGRPDAYKHVMTYPLWS